jgi:hypothetical protein
MTFTAATAQAIASHLTKSGTPANVWIHPRTGEPRIYLNRVQFVGKAYINSLGETIVEHGKNRSSTAQAEGERRFLEAYGAEITEAIASATSSPAAKQPRFDKAAIMRRAWTLLKFGKEANLSEALKAAWAEAKLRGY